MSRDDGFNVADIDTSYFEDAKMRDLWQRTQDAGLMAECVVIHAATLLASWRQGDRVTARQACPLWLRIQPDALEQLEATGLLDADHRIPEPSFTVWFGKANARRELRRSAGRTGGLASGKVRSTTGEADVQHPSTNREATVQQPSTVAEPNAEPVRPSVPSVPSEPVIAPAQADPKRDGLHNVNSTVAGIWETATGHSLLASGAYAQERLDDMCRRHPVHEVGAAIINARKSFPHIPEDRALIVAMLKLLDPISREAPRPASRPVGRKDPAVLRSNHMFGQHDDAPAKGCDLCEGAA